MSSARTTRLGVYGGTFNPIHLGHLRAAEEIAEQLDLDQMLFVPSARPPHKAAAKETIAAPEDRLDWVRRATENNPRFAVDDLELVREGPSYSVDTLEILGARTAPEKPVFALGADAFELLGTWREPRRLATLAHLAITGRPPWVGGSLEMWLPECLADDFELADDGRSGRHRNSETWIRLIEITPLEISASEIRERIRTGKSVRYLLPDPIVDAVLKNEAYQNQAYPE